MLNTADWVRIVTAGLILAGLVAVVIERVVTGSIDSTLDTGFKALVAFYVTANTIRVVQQKWTNGSGGGK